MFKAQDLFGILAQQAGLHGKISAEQTFQKQTRAVQISNYGAELVRLPANNNTDDAATVAKRRLEACQAFGANRNEIAYGVIKTPHLQALQPDFSPTDALRKIFVGYFKRITKPTAGVNLLRFGANQQAVAPQKTVFTVTHGDAPSIASLTEDPNVIPPLGVYRHAS